MTKIKFLFFLALGIFIFHWVYKFFAGPESIQLILNAKYKIFYLVIAHIPTLYFDSLAWIILMMKNKLSTKTAFIITWISQTSGKFIPSGNITGEFVRFYLARRSGQKFSEASSTVLMDLFIATFSLFIIGLAALIFIVFSLKSNLILNQFQYLILAFSLISLGTLFFLLIIRKRVISKFLVSTKKFEFLSKKNIFNLLRLDISLNKLSHRKWRLLSAVVLRLMGWIAGAFEIYVFFWVIGVDAKITDVIIIESVTAIIRSAAFFIPSAIGVQELAFVIVGELVGYSSIVSFSVAIGRRLREIMVGIPAIITWIFIFRKQSNHFN
ncbi:MAG: hypothetical protein CM15mP40_05390 [Alphaproteobacteria bacterium]|nr:MAG: hypothetical protein CM15mP40_05390 [Alphaproteobacteria bacterium]